MTTTNSEFLTSSEENWNEQVTMDRPNQKKEPTVFPISQEENRNEPGKKIKGSPVITPLEEEESAPGRLLCHVERRGREVQSERCKEVQVVISKPRLILLCVNTSSKLGINP